MSWFLCPCFCHPHVNPNFHSRVYLHHIFRPLVSPGMEGMLIHIPKPGKSTTWEHISCLPILIVITACWSRCQLQYKHLDSIQSWLNIILHQKVKRRFLHFGQGLEQQGDWEDKNVQEIELFENNSFPGWEPRGSLLLLGFKTDGIYGPRPLRYNKC